MATNPAQRSVFVLHRGTLHRLPDGMVLGIPTRLGPLARTRLLSWPGKLRMAADLVLPRRRAGGDEAIGAFFRRRLGREALEKLGAPLLGGIHAGDVERLSMRATFPRLVEMEARHRSLIRAFAAARAGAQDGAAAEAPFYSLAGGLGELADALVASLAPDGLRLAAAVRSLRRDEGRYVLDVEGAGEVRAAGAVLAVPPPAAARLMEALDPSAASLLARIPFVLDRGRVPGLPSRAREASSRRLRPRRGRRRRSPHDRLRLLLHEVPGPRSRRPRAPACLPGQRPGPGHPRPRRRAARRDGPPRAGTRARLLRATGAGAGVPLASATPQMQVGHLDLLPALDGRLPSRSRHSASREPACGSPEYRHHRGRSPQGSGRG